MTTQQAPHTPLWRRFLALPHTRLGWWAIGLAAPGLVLLPFVLSGASVPWVGELLGGLLFITGLVIGGPAGGIVGALAVGAGERSLLVWLAQVPAAVFFFGLFSAFQEHSLWVGLSVGVLAWAVITFSLIYLSQGVHSRRSGAIGSRGRSS